MVDLAARLRESRILVAPGVYDPLSARIAEQAGCAAVFVSGAALSLAQFGLSDFGLMSASELIDAVARIADRVTVPVLVDGDSGYGNAANLQRLVRGLCRAGAAAVQIEDQLAVKPPTALGTRPLVTVGEMVGKIHAAQDARLSGAFLISARTDALATRDIGEALERGEAYISAGCDLLFLEGLKRREDADALVAMVAGRVPLVHNLLESGGSSFADAAEAQEAGFALALYPATGLGAAVSGLQSAYAAIAAGSSAGVALTGMAAINAIVGTPELARRIAGYGVAA